jgi:hypothetical protein
MHAVEHFECACHSDEHTLKFTLDDYDIWASVYLFQYQSFWKRIWIAIKYIFGSHCGEGHWDCFMLKHEDITRLIALLEKSKHFVGKF